MPTNYSGVFKKKVAIVSQNTQEFERFTWVFKCVRHIFVDIHWSMSKVYYLRSKFEMKNSDENIYREVRSVKTAQ